jgi:hypothetical protein
MKKSTRVSDLAEKRAIEMARRAGFLLTIASSLDSTLVSADDVSMPQLDVQFWPLLGSGTMFGFWPKCAPSWTLIVLWPCNLAGAIRQ